LRRLRILLHYFRFVFDNFGDKAPRRQGIQLEIFLRPLLQVDIRRLVPPILIVVLNKKSLLIKRERRTPHRQALPPYLAFALFHGGFWCIAMAFVHLLLIVTTNHFGSHDS
jgi:hypothetical protein